MTNGSVTHGHVVGNAHLMIIIIRTKLFGRHRQKDGKTEAGSREMAHSTFQVPGKERVMLRPDDGGYVCPYKDCGQCFLRHHTLKQHMWAHDRFGVSHRWGRLPQLLSISPSHPQALECIQALRDDDVCRNKGTGKTEAIRLSLSRS